jgi:hypothetical protein
MFRLGDVRLRSGDKAVWVAFDFLVLLSSLSFLQIYSKMKEDVGIRYKVKKIEKHSDKVLVLIQVRNDVLREGRYWTGILRLYWLESTSTHTTMRKAHQPSMLLPFFDIFPESCEVTVGRFDSKNAYTTLTYSLRRGCHCTAVWFTAKIWHGIVSLWHNALEGFSLKVIRYRCISAKAWEDRPIVMRQIEQLGERSSVSFFCCSSLWILFDIYN